MASKQPPALKRKLIEEAGGKCANPECSRWRTHIHHIKHWAVYKSHDGKHMIAICPSCHDETHHGCLPISDDTLYEWKGITRSPVDHRDHIYVEPAPECRLLAGSIVLATHNPELIIFKLSNNNSISFRVLDDEDIILIDARIRAFDGRQVLK